MRCIAPDLIGFGRSDKPVERDDYTYAGTSSGCARWWSTTCDLTDITFFGQDWGGLIGLRLVAENPDRFARVAIGNTGLPTGHEPPSQGLPRLAGVLARRRPTSRSASSSRWRS